VVALLGGPRRIDRGRAVEELRVVLVVLPTDEAVEVLEAGASGPVIVGSDRGRFEDWHFVAFAELRGRIAIQLEDFRKRRARVGAQRVVAWRRRGNLGDAAHADRVVIAARQHGRPRRRAERGRVEAGVLQAGCGEALGIRGPARTAKRARCTKADIVEQNDEHVGCASRRAQRADRRKLRVRIFCVIRSQSDRFTVRDRQHFTAGADGLGHVVVLSHG